MQMKKIVAIGGGTNSFRVVGKKIETTSIDQEIIQLSGKQNPQVLFIPTAMSDAEEYIQAFVNYFGQLGCRVDSLLLIRESALYQEISKKIFSADIIYVGGGNTLMMMRLWRKFGIDVLLKQAYERGVVMSGVSAGAICWFELGNSDSRKFKNPEADYIKVRGLGLVKALVCPHYDGEADRQISLKKMMKKTAGVAIALDDFCAIEIIDDRYRVLSSRQGGQAYKVYWNKNQFFHEAIALSRDFMLLEQLIRKR